MSSFPSVSFEGLALHAGTPARVGLVPIDAATPLEIEAEGVCVTRDRLVVVRTDRGVMVRLGEDPGAPTIDLVEHLFAALGGLGIAHGVRVVVEGGEVPLLDGGAAELSRGLSSLELPVSRPLPVVRATFGWSRGEARYEIAPADSAALEVDIAFDHPAIGRQTCLFGFDRGDFLRRIAPARTFGFARDWPSLLAAGRARGVDRRAVQVFEDASTETTAATTDEPARHKLLDLLGDCTLAGGPFLGVVRATCPGHAATHAFFAAARAAGALP